MNYIFKFIFLILFLTIPISTIHAGGPLITNIDGDPVIWDVDPIEIEIEGGGSGCGNENVDDAIDRVARDLAEWTSIGTVDLSFTLATGIIDGVDACNYTDFLFIVDGRNIIIFDADGLITDDIGGSGAKDTTLGFTDIGGFELNADGIPIAITDAQFVINCFGVAQGTVSTASLDGTIIHEMGHFIGLDHTQINAEFASDGDSSTNTDIPIMYPFDEDQFDPEEDDIVALSTLYPSSSFFTSGDSSSTYCKVTGTLLDSSGNEMMCADVQAIDDSDDALNSAFVSGRLASGTIGNSDGDIVDKGECDAGCGDFTLYLRPSRTLSLVRVRSINPVFINGSGIRPCVDAQLPNCDDVSGEACVEDETLVTNTSGDNITSKINSECLAGATVALGNISTNSVSVDSVSSSLSARVSNTSQKKYSLATLQSKLLRSSNQISAQTSCPESGGGSGGE